VNQCRNRQRWWRRRRADRATSLDELTSVEEAKASSGANGAGESPFELACRRERVRRLQAALLELPFHHRAVLVLREVEGLSCEEIASALGLPEGTVKSRLARARDSLKQRLLPAPSKGQRP
jgi:RNA polymerase sigma-70 factor (ECF subfamily)